MHAVQTRAKVGMLLAIAAALVVGFFQPTYADAASAPKRPAMSSAVTPYQVPPPDPQYSATVPQVLKYVTGKKIGPSVYTEYASFIITGFYKDSTGRYVRTRSGVSCNICTTALTPQTAPNSLGSGPVMQPNSWYNPASWDWGHILGTAWNATWNGCLKGSLTGLVGSAGGTLMVNLIARGGKVFVGPYGYAAIAVGGCIVAALNY